MTKGNGLKEIGNKIYAWRYWIAVVILTVCVLLQLSGSSIGAWSLFLEGTYEQSREEVSGDLMGEFRSLRSDEWAVNTPMAFSQYYNQTGAFPYFSDTMRGTKTDAYIVYGQPVKSWEAIFRPFQIGYIFLGPSMGLAFFWVARMLALFLMSLEFGMYLTGKKKALAFCYATLVCCAPVVAWWFAINGLVEMLVFGQLAILLFIRWMYADKLWKKLLLSAGIAWCGAAYILVFYPSWQIPLGYAYLCLLIGIILRERKQVVWKKSTIFISLGLLLLLMGVSLGAIFWKSRETIELVLNTAYPGTRTFVGNGSFWRSLSWMTSILFPFLSDPAIGQSNVCEEAAFFSFFPLGIIWGAVQLCRKGKKDPMLCSMIAGACFLTAYCTFTWPAILAKVTLLGMVQARRVTLGVGFLSLLLLFYLLAQAKPIQNRRMVAAVTALGVAGAGALAFVCRFYYALIMGEKLMLLLFGILIAGMAALLLAVQTKRYSPLVCYVLLISIYGGLTVNPLHQGTDAIYESNLTKAVQKETKADEGQGLWLVENLAIPYINVPLMVGAPTVNSTNVYPYLERWQALDTTGESEKLYNRYAHIQIFVTGEDSEQETFVEREINDQMLVYLKPSQLKDMGIKHIMAVRGLTEYNTEVVTFEEKDKIGNFYIYSVEYESEK